jgi:hypothetical protein
VLSFPNMMHFFADKFSCLRGWRFALTLIFPDALYGFLIWHGIDSSQLFRHISASFARQETSSQYQG